LKQPAEVKTGKKRNPDLGRAFDESCSDPTGAQIGKPGSSRNFCPCGWSRRTMAQEGDT
jgi:hypothetical protein